MSAINLTPLRRMISRAEGELPYFEKMQGDDAKWLDERREELETLRRLLAYHSGEIYVPGEAVSAQSEAA